MVATQQNTESIYPQPLNGMHMWDVAIQRLERNDDLIFNSLFIIVESTIFKRVPNSMCWPVPQILILIIISKLILLKIRMITVEL
jgi:hypothetical protein